MSQAAAIDGEYIRVLFIEDSEVDVELILLELQREGFLVDWTRVQSMFQLKEVLHTDTFDIILSDYSMPVFSGIDALEIVRDFDPYIPFIFVSGTIGEDRAIESLRNGATDYILKGNLRRLGTAVRRALAENKEREQARATAAERERLAAILEATSDYVAIYTPELRLNYINAAGRRLLGLDQDAPVNTLSAFDIHPEWAVATLDNEVRKTLLQGRLWQGEGALLARDGREIPLSKVVIGHSDADGRITHFSTIGRDIRDRKAFEDQISYLANYDGLTDLPNRALLRDRVLQSLVHARRSGRPLALIVADVDRFKLINDGFGHEAGDVLLRKIGRRLQRIARDGDTVARLGADGFAILAVDLHRPGDVLAVVRKIQAGMQGPFLIKGQEMHVTLSMGASLFPRDGGDFETLLRDAESAMHRAKGQGRDGFEYYTAEMTRLAEDRMEVENALRQALARKELSLHYQPLVSLGTGRIVGTEALLRWYRRGQGWISPGHFIPVAEESDLILNLDGFALRTACRQLRAWNERTREPLRMAVNISARQFLSSGFIDMVDDVLRSTGARPGHLELEITERLLIEDKEQGMETINRLKDLGIRIAVDDFGTGYSSLSYLSRLPIDRLKIDKSFVQRLSTDESNVHIVQAVISLAHSLEMEVIAEGIETQSQMEFLQRHGCEEGQGFLFSGALSSGELEPLIETRSLPVTGS